jgi:hypothetical protein
LPSLSLPADHPDRLFCAVLARVEESKMNFFYALGWAGVIYLILYALGDFINFLASISEHHRDDDDE